MDFSIFVFFSHDIDDFHLVPFLQLSYVSTFVHVFPHFSKDSNVLVDLPQAMTRSTGSSYCLALHGATRFTKPTDWLPWVDATWRGLSHICL